MTDNKYLMTDNLKISLALFNQLFGMDRLESLVLFEEWAEIMKQFINSQESAVAECLTTGHGTEHPWFNI